MAKVAAIIAFMLVMALTIPIVWAVSNLSKQTEFPGGVPPERFEVVFRDATKPDAPLKFTQWRYYVALPEVEKARYTFLLAGAAGSVRVLENRKDSQVIEVTHRNTHTTWSRYEAFADRIVPISFQGDGGGFLLLIVVVALFVPAIDVARRVERRMTPR